MPTVLITGANRGIGLELARQYAADGWRVIATCRNPGAAADLQAVGGDIDVYPLDVDDPSTLDALVTSLKGQEIDVLFNNAGININKVPSIGDIDYDAWAQTMATNVFAPIRVAWAFKDNVLASPTKVMAFTSSLMGSIGRNGGGNAVYRSSKTALNMAAHCLSVELADKGAIVALLHPGHVRTDMGGASAPVTAEESAAGLRDVVAKLTPQDNGCFRNYDGTEFPW
ncbi:MAG: SDR family oxidoreductase [Alphaproteobacteria bacterium]|nr:SDR family oxidoreductase [Alphaproteobacteria bacterium]